MGKNQSASNLTNVIQVSSTGNVLFVSGSTTLMSISSSGAITTTGVISGSNALSASYASASTSASYSSNADTLASSFTAFSSSILAQTASFNAFSASINTATSSFSGRVGVLESYTASLNLKTASFATTGSNNFTAVQHIADTTNPTGFDTTASLYTEGGLGIKKDTYISSSLYIKGNLTVYGTQSVSYITSSQLNISTNLITVNTATPSVRFGGIAVQDSGSVSGLTGSLLWDSQNNSWLYNNPSGSGNYDSSLVIMGPRNSSALGSEVGLNCNYLIQGHGHHHTTSSGIFHDGSTTCLPGIATIGSDIILSAANPVIYGGTAVGGVSVSNNTGGSYIKIFGASHATTPNTTAFINANSTVLTINEFGSVGIGTPTPCTMLHVQGQATIGCSTYRTRIDGSSAGTWISFGTLACTNSLGRIGTYESSYILDSNNGNISFRFANAEKAYINSSGQACFLGSITTGDTLTVNRAKVGSGVENLNALVLRLTGTGAIGDGANIVFANTNNIGTAYITGITGADNVAYGSIAFSTRNYFTDSVIEAMRIDNSIRIGIGCTTPLNSLTVNGNIGMPNTYNWGIVNDNDTNWGFRVCSTGANYSTFLSYAGDAGSDRRGGIYNQNGHWVAYGNCQGHFIVQCNLSVGGTAILGSISSGPITGGTLYTSTQRLTNTSGNYANMVHKVQGASGAFSQVVICVSLNGAGGWGYIINSGGTSGGYFQSGGGYTNGTGNYSHSSPVGSGYTVSSPASDVIRFVGPGGVHPFTSIQMFGSLSQDFGDQHVCIYFS